MSSKKRQAVLPRSRSVRLSPESLHQTSEVGTAARFQDPLRGTSAGARLTDRGWYVVFGSWLVATVSMLGALFFSNVMEVPICALCWYQRIFMFPLVIILGIALMQFDRGAVRYGLPLAVIGWLIAAFHMLVTAGFISEDLQPCSQGVPCAHDYVKWFGFVTIPLLSFTAFSTIIALLAATYHKRFK